MCECVTSPCAVQQQERQSWAGERWIVDPDVEAKDTDVLPPDTLVIVARGL